MSWVDFILRGDCHVCGAAMTVSAGPGRLREYRGAVCEIPRWLEFDVCTECGAEWMTGQQIDQMSRAFELQLESQEQKR